MKIKKIKKLLEYLFSLPKSIYICLRLLPFQQAIKLPILVRYNVKMLSTSGLIDIVGGNFARLRIGFGNVGVFDKTYERSIIQIDGQITLKGKATFGHGSRICVMENGVLTIGDNFINSAMQTIVCGKQITIGENVLTSWNTLIMDTDFHQSRNVVSGELSIVSKPITIGNNVWMGTRAVILKGSDIADGCIIGANSLVSGKFEKPNSLIVGNPGIVKRENITRNMD
jgi:acetyltransferase-like isoleucine patch superfamily enzyme